jgi:hypothetical protein
MQWMPCGPPPDQTTDRWKKGCYLISCLKKENVLTNLWELALRSSQYYLHVASIEARTRNSSSDHLFSIKLLIDLLLYVFVVVKSFVTRSVDTCCKQTADSGVLSSLSELWRYVMEEIKSASPSNKRKPSKNIKRHRFPFVWLKFRLFRTPNESIYIFYRWYFVVMKIHGVRQHLKEKLRLQKTNGNYTAPTSE